MWSPSSHTHLKPSRSKTHASRLYETGLSLGMPRREGESYSLRENEAGSNKTAVAAGESGLRQDLIERSFLLCLFQKQPHCFHEILLGLDLGRCTGREIKFRRVRNVHLSFFEHLTRKFNLHAFHRFFAAKPLLSRSRQLTTSCLRQTTGCHPLSS